MKSLCVFALVFCFVYVAVAEVNKKCSTNDDCDQGECCTSGLFLSGKCKKLKAEGEWCVPGIGEREKYYLMCPCAEGLSCQAEEIEEQEGGVVIYKNSKCLAKQEETTVSEENTVSEETDAE
ncbi:hypothetical protein NPIL_202961 [Nephila pilipes]|uniref:Uncharacterized protein n=1 Tax=Nephila pilipes TaxID=299642 RepID=A0A8X6QKR1_NEPPI|nr:hypothetical protein NPIL_202961 [Nephila pilipes]